MEQQPDKLYTIDSTPSLNNQPPPPSRAPDTVTSKDHRPCPFLSCQPPFHLYPLCFPLHMDFIEHKFAKIDSGKEREKNNTTKGKNRGGKSEKIMRHLPAVLTDWCRVICVISMPMPFVSPLRLERKVGLYFRHFKLKRKCKRIYVLNRINSAVLVVQENVNTICLHVPFIICV